MNNDQLRDELAKQEAAPYHETAPARELAFKNGWNAHARNIQNEQEHVHQALFDLYHICKEKIGTLGYNTFINSKEVEEYREWLRNHRYKHRIDWFEKQYPNGLYYKDDDGTEYGVRLETKKFLAEADAAYQSKDENELQELKWQVGQRDGRIDDLLDGIDKAQAELRAMYKRVGIEDSNVLKLLDALSETDHKTKTTS